MIVFLFIGASWFYFFTGDKLINLFNVSVFSLAAEAFTFACATIYWAFAPLKDKTEIR